VNETKNSLETQKFPADGCRGQKRPNGFHWETVAPLTRIPGEGRRGLSPPPPLGVRPFFIFFATKTPRYKVKNKFKKTIK